MNSFDSLLLLLLVGAASAAVIVVAAGLVRSARTRRRARRRVVEKPNSHYTSQLARDTQARHRWHEIALERVHEINRGEVERLIARADAMGVEGLRASERAFLDQMAQIAPRTPSPEAREPRPPLPQLRERPD